MLEWPAVDLIFLLAAGVGSLGVGIWLVLQLASADTDHPTHVAHDVDASGTADLSFTLLSFQGISAFLTMFGLVGLALRREGMLLPVWAIFGGMAAGLVTTWLVAQIFKWFNSFQSNGTVDLKTATGKTGRVYLTIGGAGTVGKVEVAISGRLQVMNAISEDEIPLPTGTTVVVVGFFDGQTLIVKKLN